MEKKWSKRFQWVAAGIPLTTALIGLIAYIGPRVLAKSLSLSEVAFAVGILLAIVGLVFWWRHYRALTVELREAKSSIEKISKTEGVEKLVLAKEEAAKLELDRNRQRRYRISSLVVDEFIMFRSFRWNLSPGINVLLGKNGYGKSLLFRTTVGMLWNDWQGLMRSTRSKKNASIQLEILADGETRTIRSVTGELRSEVGRMPVLAIPDARFIDRTRETVSPPPDSTADLIRSGAEVFLSGQPFDAVMNAFLYDLCDDYRTLGSFSRAPFPFLARVVSELTEDEFAFHSIERHSGAAKYTIKVVTGAAPSDPLPITLASQGTLSILSVFGLIYRFLRTVWGDETDEVFSRPAVVFIDELDAHLHPSWQQKIIRLLRTTFPNVQFIVSAHSPVIAAGCLKGEVAVLRKGTDGFKIEEIGQDLIGLQSIELYKMLFEVDDIDEALQYYSFQQDRRGELDRRIQELRRRDESEELSPQERAEFDEVTREREVLQRAEEARERREKPEEEIAKLKAQVRNLKLELGKKQS